MFPRIDKGPVEYTLDMYPAIHEKTKTPCMRFHFETTEDFHHFRYNISIEHEVGKKSLRFVIKGLKPLIVALPEVGKAQVDVDFFDLAGEYDVTVQKPGKIVNTFRIAISFPSVRVLKDVTPVPAFLAVEAATEV